MNLLVVDGQGGGVGRQLVEQLKKNFSEDSKDLKNTPISIIAVGTNAMATQAMRKAGADHAATGENAVVVGCRNADVIIGPIGIVIADSLYGEITPVMANAVAQSQAVRVLLPMNLCNNYIAGVGKYSTSEMIEDCICKIKELCF